MNKELEALDRIKKMITHISNDYDYGLLDDVYLLEQSLTPPTSEELCRELSEYLSKDVKYDNIKKRFYFKAIVRESFVTLFYNNSIQLNYLLPPRLIELIGKFYKGEIENE